MGSSFSLRSILCIFRHFLICLYGAVALGFVLAGRVKELKVIHILTGKLILTSSWRVVALGLNLTFLFLAAAYYGVENSFRGLAPQVVQVHCFFPISGFQ